METAWGVMVNKQGLQGLLAIVFTKEEALTKVHEHKQNNYDLDETVYSIVPFEPEWDYEEVV